MGGDLAGKQLVPVVAQGGVSRAHFNGTDFVFETAQEITDFERRAAELGAYTLRTDQEFVGQLAADQELVEQTLRRLILERTEELVALAADRRPVLRSGRQRQPGDVLGEHRDVPARHRAVLPLRRRPATRGRQSRPGLPRDPAGVKESPCWIPRT